LFELVAGLVQIDLLPAEHQRLAPGAEGLAPHAQDVAVERDRAVQVGDGQHQMVEMVDGDHALSLSR
jgi:hypothetical protein